jgi:hypothetical protein
MHPTQRQPYRRYRARFGGGRRRERRERLKSIRREAAP